jgi:hypothetical protein
VLLDHDIEVPASCREGTCGTQLQQLEAILDVSLVTRTSRKVVPARAARDARNVMILAIVLAS